MQKINLLLFFIIPALIACAQPSPVRTEEKSNDIALQDTVPFVQPEIGKWTKDELLGKFDPAKHTDFILINKTHTGKSGIFMRKEAYEAFTKMHTAALKDGVQLTIISATRNFDSQKKIWENKWVKEKYKGWKDADIAKDILKYSSMPGTSRHHWGTDIDLNSVDPAYFSSGNGKKIYDWLVVHASEYGYALTYTSKNSGRTGYEEEKWHWSYMPLSKPMLIQYNSSISYSDINGFKGAEAAPQTDVFKLYVNGIESSLLK